MQEFQIRRDDFVQNRLVEVEPAGLNPTIGDGEILLKIDRFAVTANNITYAVAGDRLGYWQFFPPTGGATEDWGMMPVWGFADVVESNIDDVPVGDRLFGYFPPATYLKISPVNVTAARLIDGAEHRSALPAPYNSYSRVNAEPGYNRDMDNERMLLWPLFITSFCLWDALRDKNWYGAEQVVIVSASSKTSIGLAYALAADATAPRAIAITSTRNLELVNSLDLHRQSVTYESLKDIDAGVPTTIVDMSGNGEVLGRLHTHLGDNMTHCVNVGLTHWDETHKGEGIIRERSEFFFAPSHIQQRVKDWGPQEFAEKTSAFMQETTLKSRDWLKLKRLDGLHGLADIYEQICEGRIAADQGLIVEL